MHIEIDPSGTIEGLARAIQRATHDPGVRGLQILACQANTWSTDEVNHLVGSISLPLFGGVFPGIIHEGAKLDRGTIVLGLTKRPTVRVVRGLNQSSPAIDGCLDASFCEACSGQTMFVYLDCTARRIGALIECLFTRCGLRCNYIGGGAGSLDFVSKPCILTNDGLLQESAVLALVDLRSSIGVSHGWHTLAGPFAVTESEGNVVKSLDWVPAFEVYRQVVEAHSRRSFATESFYELSKFYPFVLGKLGVEGVVRDPVSRNPDGSLVCVGEMPPDSLVSIVRGDPDSMIQAAGHARLTALAGHPAPEAGTVTLVIECISRALCLGDALPRELEAARVPGSPQFGALTIGEVANSAHDYLEFYNKTTVVGILESP
jgi:hypothetical protein